MSRREEPDSISGHIVAALSLGLLAVAAAASISAAALTVLVARTVITPPKRVDEDARVLAVADATVTLTRTAETLAPGRYSLWFGGGSGHARVGDILATNGSSVTRELVAVDYGDLREGSTCRLSGWFYLSPRQLGVPCEDVEVLTPVGPAPAWLIPAREQSDRWAIHVHGRAVRKAETIRAVPVFRNAGYTSLLVSYRNDGEAPASEDNRYALGDVEWQDVDAAIRFAVDRGARHIVLVGWSMGGATVLQAATRSSRAGYIRGIVLDSPVVDWRGVLDFQGALMRLPRSIRAAAVAIISRPWGRRLTGQAASIDLDRLDFVRRAGELRWPVLLLHSDDDGYVPADASRALAAARPDIVTFVPFDTARHAKIWNHDEPRWTAAIEGWLRTRVD